MAVMASSRLLTRAELDALPEDGLRHELIDGQFVMSPAPGIDHQTITGSLYWMLRNVVRGTELKVLAAPCDVVLGPNVVQPDVVLAARRDFGADDLPVPPILAVEVLSPSTARRDRGRKRELYSDAGVKHYWIVDPEAPSVTVYELIDGAYLETAHVVGDHTLTIEHLVPLRFTPADLLKD
jgi:Uma2 family endonuclease